jgi:cytochrome c biogenesis protein
VVYFGSLADARRILHATCASAGWLRIKPGHALLAMSSAKHTIDFERLQTARALDTSK